LKTYLTLHEVEGADFQSSGGEDEPIEVPRGVALWRARLFTVAGLLQTLAWIAAAGFHSLTADTVDAWTFTQCLLMAFSWLYTAVRPIVSPPVTAPYDLFSVYVLHVVGGALLLGGHLFDHAVAAVPLPSTLVLIGFSANLVVVFTLLYVTVQMPMNLPSPHVKKEDIVRRNVFPPFDDAQVSQGRSVSPEDYTRLWGWMTFNWVFPLIKRVSFASAVVLHH
jgi:hypothetical protein